MAWVTFNVVQANSNESADGQVQFTFTYSDSTKQTINAGAVLQYARDSNPTPPPNPKTLYTTPSAVNISNGVFTFVSSSAPVNLANNVQIPAAPPFPGGTYDQLSGLVYNPTTTKLTGTFHDSGKAPGTDPDCNWDSTGVGFPEHTRAAY